MSPRLAIALLPAAALLAGPLLLAVSGADDPKPKATDREPPTTTIYHTDRDHLWNRTHAALYTRTGPDGKFYGEDRLEPLLWGQSNHLLEGKTADRAVAVLEEFDRTKGETLIDDPVKRAVLQRDLWLVYSWLASRAEDDARKRLAVPLAKVIRRLALTPEQIAKLPDVYADAVASKKFAARFDPEKPEQPYLPPDLFDATGPWVCVGRKDGPTAPLHLDVHNADQTINPFANSAFLVFVKRSGGRDATLAFLKELAAFDKPLYVSSRDPKDGRYNLLVPNPGLPPMPKGTEVALVRRALLIDSSRRIIASPLVESVQLRVARVDMPKFTAETFTKIDKAIPLKYADWQAFSEFQLRRAALFANESGGLRDVSLERNFKTGFASHVWDPFDTDGRAPQARPFPERALAFESNRASCIGCHQFPGVYGFNSYHMNFTTSARRELDEELGGTFKPKAHALTATTVPKVEEAAIKWREERKAWKGLLKLMPE